MTDPQPVDEAGQPIPTPSELKGEALAQALDDAGLPKTGTADEKRASLAEVEPEPEESVNPGLAMAAPAYNPPADFEHTAYNPENVQHIS
jgi:hypothetical protein